MAADVQTGEAPRPAAAAASCRFAARLNRLFASVRTPQGRPYTNDAIITAIAASGGPTISRGYLSELRTGKKDNPTLRHIEALAAFFGVDPAVLVRDAASAPPVGDHQILSDPVLVELVLRLARLSSAELDLISVVVGAIERLREEPGSSVVEGVSSRRGGKP